MYIVTAVLRALGYAVDPDDLLEDALSVANEELKSRRINGILLPKDIHREGQELLDVGAGSKVLFGERLGV